MSEMRVSDPEAVTSPIYRISGQRSRWVYPDPRLTPEHSEVLRDVNISQRGIAQSRFGYDEYNATQLSGGEAAVGLWQGTFKSGTTKQVIVTPTKVYSDTGTARVNITGSSLTGSVDDRVDFTFVKDQVILNNTVDVPRVWAGDDSTPTNTSNLATIPFTKAKKMVQHQNLLFALGTTESGTYFPTRIRWCDINRQTYVVDINRWLAQDLYEIYDGGTAIVSAVDNWGWLLTFKEDGMYPGRIVYGPLGYYDFQLGSEETGTGPRRGFSPLARMSIIGRPEFVFGLASEGLFLVRPDLSFEIVNSDDIEDFFALNAGRLKYAQSFIREKDHQIRTLVSSADNTSHHDFELVYDWDTGDTWIDRPSVNKNYAQRVLISNKELDWFAGSDGYIYKGNDATFTDDNGTGITWQIKMTPNDLGLPGKLKHIVNIRTLFRKRKGAGNVNVRVFIDEGRQSSVVGTISAGGEYTWNTSVPWNTGKKWPGTKARRADSEINRICETISIQWSGEQPASIEGYVVDYIPLEN